MRKLKPCSGGAKHSWEFLRNVVTKTSTLNFVTITQRGVYQCRHCGQRKYGDHRPEQMP